MRRFHDSFMRWRQYWTEVAGVLEELVQLRDQRLLPKEDKVDPAILALVQLQDCCSYYFVDFVDFKRKNDFFWISVEIAPTP